MGRTYIAIDLKSFYASAECAARNLDPLDTNLAVADPERTDKTICLALSPSLKRYTGLSGRARLFEVRERIRKTNRERGVSSLSLSSCLASELDADPSLAIDFIIAPPQMAMYMKESARIYDIYLRHVSPDDIHVYSIDEVFIDATDYLKARGQSAHDFAMSIVREVLLETGITATVGIGTNLYLAKIAMDIHAKHMKADKDGVRIAELDEMSYREKLWTHRPLTDFWRVGRGYGRKLEAYRIYTMGDVARCSIEHEDLLYRLFGVNAELLIDHAWGWEPCTIEDIKRYRPKENSIGAGQVLQCPYSAEKALVVAKEMADSLSLDLVGKGLASDQLVLTIGYDIENVKDDSFTGEVSVDFYGRSIPKHSHGSISLGRYTSSSRIFRDSIESLFSSIVSSDLLVRRLYVTANHVIPEKDAMNTHQADLFEKPSSEDSQKEKKVQAAAVSIKNKFGKNALLRGMNLVEGATQRGRNSQIGGHKA